jgi:HlyD family secretion protein
MKKRSNLIFIILPIAAILLVVLIHLRRSRSNIPEVHTTQISRGDIIERISGSGQVTPLKTVKIGSEIMGRIENLVVDEGQMVQQGDLLLELDSRRYRTLRDQARYALESAEKTLMLEKIHLDLVMRQYEREKSLYDRDMLSMEGMDAAKSRFAAQKVRLEIAEANVMQAREMRSAAENDLSKTRIISPISGMVTDLRMTEGETVIQGTMNNMGTVILTIADLKEMTVKLFVDEIDVVKLRRGQEAEVWFDAFPGHSAEGRVHTVGYSSIRETAFGRRIDEGNTNFRVDVLLSEVPKGLRPGMMATAEIMTDRHDDIYYVPLQCIVISPGRERDYRDIQGVYIVRRNSCHFQAVRSGISSEKYMEIDFPDIREGISVVSGPYAVFRDLADGSQVRLTKGK